MPSPPNKSQVNQTKHQVRQTTHQVRQTKHKYANQNTKYAKQNTNYVKNNKNFQVWNLHSKILIYAVLSWDNFCREFTHFLAYLLQAYKIWWRTKNDNYQVCLHIARVLLIWFIVIIFLLDRALDKGSLYSIKSREALLALSSFINSFLRSFGRSVGVQKN